MPTKKSNPMTQDELKELQDAVASVSVQDIHLGRVLDLMATHLARLNSLDYPVVQQETPPAEAPAPAPAPAEAPVEQAPAEQTAPEGSV